MQAFFNISMKNAAMGAFHPILLQTGYSNSSGTFLERETTRQYNQAKKKCFCRIPLSVIVLEKHQQIVCGGEGGRGVARGNSTQVMLL